MFLKNHWYIGGRLAEIHDKPVGKILLGEPVVMYRGPGGKIVALEDRCVHRNVPLSMGHVRPEGTLQCLYHGMQYNSSGACVFIPEQTKVPAAACVRSFPAVERYEWVWIWMGDPELADPSLIPFYPWFDQPGWRARTGQLFVKAGYQLVIDNLLNMAHLPYVHPRTIGSEGVVKDAKVSVKRDGLKVKLERKMYDIEPPPTYKTAGGFTGNVNRWQFITFMAPSCFEFNTGVIEVDHDIPEGGDPKSTPQDARILARHTMHSVVPELDGSCHYYVGFSYDPREMSEEMADFVFDAVFKTFVEDVEILEAQQKTMEILPGRRTIDIVSDGAGMQAMRILKELEAAETTALTV